MMHPFFIRLFAQNIDYNGSYWTIQSEINQGRPVILSGYNQSNSSWFGLVVEYNEGHEWVCDGFNETNIYYLMGSSMAMDIYSFI